MLMRVQPISTAKGYVHVATAQACVFLLLPGAGEHLDKSF